MNEMMYDNAAIYVTKHFEFETGHFLQGYCKGAKNTCGNIHGHTYKLEVTLSGKINPETGMVIDFKELSEIVKTHIVSKLDHSFLNEDISEIGGEINRPTAERMAVWIFHTLGNILTLNNISVNKVKLNETSTSWVEYYGRTHA